MTDDGRPRERTNNQVNISDQAWGSDFVADLIKQRGFEFVTFNPGASFRGIEESIVNYNDNEPQVIETPNEGLSVSIAHGYAKATGEPALCILHNVVGTMNAAMNIYNAFIDRVPILMLSGTGPMRKTQRRPWIDWIHTANVQGNIVREYVKWDDQPTHVDGAAESILRAHEIAETRPKGPVYVTIDHDIQETPLPEPMDLPSPESYPTPTPMAPESEAIERTADRLVDAELPVFLVDQVGDSREAVDALVSLAETLGSPVFDLRWRRFNFPNTHPMYFSESQVYRDADVIVGLDVWDPDWVTGDTSTSLDEATNGEYTYIEIGTHELGASGTFPNTYSVREKDIGILADTRLAIPALSEAVERRLDTDSTAKTRARDRFDELATEHALHREAWQGQAAEEWDESPVSAARLAAEVWEVIQDDSWVLVNNMFPRWADRLWEVDEYDQYIGGYAGGAGVGYGIGAAIGGALAFKGTNRYPVNIQSDGDLMQYLGGLWILAHYDIPLLTVMHNNMTMYNSTNHRMQLAEYRGRDASYERALIGTGYVDPVPDYATVAEGLGIKSYGPIEDPDNLAESLEAAWDDVQRGEPALVDVLCQPQ